MNEPSRSPRAAVLYDRAMHEARKYWRERIESMAFASPLALDHPRPREGPPEYRVLEEPLDGGGAQEIGSRLQRLTAGRPFLVYTALVVGLELACSRYSGQRAVTFLTPARRSEGAGANLLPIGCILDPDSSFQDLLVATKDRLADAYAHQQYPFSRMLLDLPDERRPQHLPLVAALEGFHDEVPDLAWDLLVVFDATGGAFKVSCHFDRHLYEAATLRGFARFLRTLLALGLEGMTTPLGDLWAGADQLLEGSGPWAGAGPAAALSPEPRVIHRQIERQAREGPDRVAIAEGERVTTYGTLDPLADQLARALGELKLDGRRPIVLLMDAGTEMVVSQLAVLKAGLAFAPIKLLALEVPLEEILVAVDCACVLCRPEHLADLRRLRAACPRLDHGLAVECRAAGGDEPRTVLEITRAWEVPSPPAGEAPAPEPAAVAEETSGVASVLIDARDGGLSQCRLTHAELAGVFGYLNELARIGPGDRCLLSPALDPCAQLYDTLGILGAGASVEIAAASELRDPAQLAERLLFEGITVWDLPAALALNLLPKLASQQARGKAVEGPRQIFLSGEKQSVSLARRLRNLFPRARVTGLYAAPAVGLWSTCFPLEPFPVDEGMGGTGESEAAVLAQPLPGFDHRVVTGSGETAALRTTGDLRVVRRLAPTEVATGLRARRLPNGRLIWLRGREHRFLKWGCQVELTRLEEVLCEREPILAAEVVTVGEAPAAVVAFLLADADRLSPEEVRDELVHQEAVDLIPDRCHLLEEFPLTVAGAIDHEVLHKRFLATSGPEVTDAPESGEVIGQLRPIWLQSLQMDDAGEEASFFKLGGNSLKATLLIARIKEEFAVDLSVQDFFREPSIRAIAQLIEAELKNTRHRQQAPDFKVVSRDRYRLQLPDLEG